ncbi:MAG: single-strand DNA-binding protein [Actinomycetota bacterium]|nr:single-strand DNA-binding protein [Actinomycetota bacterium]
MHTISTSIIGIAVTDVRHTVTQSGLSLARFRMVSQPRRFDSAVGAFVDQDASFLTVFAWRAMADNVVSSIHKGDPVVVVGRLRVREWEDEGRPRVTVEVDAQSIGHDLARGSARFVRSARPAAAVAGARSEPPAALEVAADGSAEEDREAAMAPAAVAAVPAARAVA